MKLTLAATLLLPALPNVDAETHQTDLKINRTFRKQWLQNMLFTTGKRNRGIEQSQQSDIIENSKDTLSLQNVSEYRRECNPRSDLVADIGRLQCGPDEYCEPNDAAALGGFCMPEAQMQRHLQSVTPEVCEPGYQGNSVESCDCSNFNRGTGQGNFICTVSSYECFFPDYCGSRTVEFTFEGGSTTSEYCYNFVVPEQRKVCYVVGNSQTCSLSVDDVECNSCEIVSVEGYTGCYDFDCSNAVPGAAGNDCLEEYLIESVFPGIFETEPPATGYVCTICEDGRPLTIPDGLVEFPSIAPLLCSELQIAADNGFILETQCALLQPFFQEPCGCLDVEPTAAPTIEAGCVSTSEEVLAVQLQNPPTKEIIICPGTNIEVGIPSNPDFSEFSDGDIPITILGDDVTIKCGEDGDPSNQCTLIGGFTQLTATPNHPFVNSKISVNNLKVQGLTFSGSLAEIPGLSSQAILLSAPGNNIIIEDCVFADLQADSIIGNTRDVLTPSQDYPPFSSSATIKDSSFERVSYNQQVIVNTDQTMNLENLVFDDVVYFSGRTDTPGSIITNERGVMTLKDSTFADIVILSTTFYWLSSTNTTSFAFSGNTAEGVFVFEESNRDPETFCRNGLIVDTVQDQALTGECRILFDNFTPSPTDVPITPAPTPRPTPAPVTPTSPPPTEGSVPTTQRPTTAPVTQPTRLTASPTRAMPSPVVSPVDTSMSMSYVFAGSERDLRDIDEIFDLQSFGRL